MTMLEDVDLDASQRAADPEEAKAQGAAKGASGLVEDSERTHDQLPSVESYKATTGNHKEIHKGSWMDNNRYIIVLGVVLTIAVIVVSISIGVVIGKSEGSAAAASKAVVPTSPNATGTSATTVVTNKTKVSRVKDVVDFVTTKTGWSSANDLANTESPQYKAAQWIADEDIRNLPIEDHIVFRSRFALAVFFFALDGKRWEHKLSWMSQHHECKWNEEWKTVYGLPIAVGVVCDTRSNNVTSIFLPSNGLRGSIPPEIGLLPSLVELDLYNNDVIGTLPDAIQKLTALTTLVMHHNFLEGTIPTWLSSLKSLRMLDLAMNTFNGYLHHTLPELTALETLNLDRNELVGDLKPLKGLKSLKTLILSNNMFTGSLTDDLLTSWPAITDIDVSDNNITGTLPASLFQNTKLVIVDLHGNAISGRLPAASATAGASHIEFLALHDTQVSGPITTAISSLTKLRHLDLSNCHFTGTLPASIGELSHLRYLFVAFNKKLTPGPIPTEWTALGNLVDLSLQSTNRQGSIPTTIANLKNLALLDLAGNVINDEIPSELSRLPKLTFLLLQHNVLTGDIPSELKTLPALETLVINDNELSGGAYFCVGNKTHVRAFVADCREIECTCCTKCCDDVNEKCTEEAWFSQQDPLANYQYKRVDYKFPGIIYPLPESSNETAFYETFGMPVVDRVPVSGGNRRHRN